MYNKKRGIEKLLGVIILLLLPLLIIPATLFAGEADKKSEVVRQGSLQVVRLGSPQAELKSEKKADFVLTIKDDLISLSAKDASIKEIVEEIGSRMEIEVVTNISKEEKVTIEFDKLSVENSIKRLREYSDIVYVKDSEKEEGKITKILVFPKGKGEELYKSTIIKEKKEKEKGEGLVRPEISVGEEAVREETPQTEPKETVKEKAPRPEPFKFEFDPSEFEEE